MQTETLLVVVAKTLGILLMFIYVLISILISRQIFLMNRAIKTKLAGFLNVIGIIHIVLVVCLMVFIIVV